MVSCFQLKYEIRIKSVILCSYFGLQLEYKRWSAILFSYGINCFLLMHNWCSVRISVDTVWPYVCLQYSCLWTRQKTHTAVGKCQKNISLWTLGPTSIRIKTVSLLLAKIYNFWQVCSFVGLLLAKIYNFWQVCSFVGLLLAKIYNFGKYVRLSVCLFVCPFCQA